VSAGEENVLAGEIFDAVSGFSDGDRERTIDRKSVSKADCRLQHFREGQRAEFPEGFGQTSNGARHAGRQRSNETAAGELSIRAHEHVSRCGRRGGLAVIERGSSSICHANDHVPAASQVPGFRIRDCQREAHRNSGVYRVAPAFEDLDAGFGGLAAAARDHRRRSKCRAGS
jgi:hypothetical protein